MKVTVYFSPNHLDDLELRDKNIVVIDVLRASTTICYAMRAGAKEIIPVGSVDQAMKIVGNLFSTTTVLCGERGAKRIEGFALGNSPAEYTPEIVEGKSLILATTNGAVALTKAKHARNAFVGAIVNVSYVAKALSEISELDTTDLVIICSGKEGDFAIEDGICAGLILQKLGALGVNLELTDGARTVLTLLHEYGSDLYTTLRESDHGKFLASIGYETDIKTCSEVDSVPIVPILEQTVIKKKLVY